MRVLSLVPAASDWLIAFGAESLLLPPAPPGQELDRGATTGPDLLITDQQTANDAKVDELRDRFGGASPEVLLFEPKTFKEALDAALALARRIDRLPAAMRFVGDREAALQALRRRIGASRSGAIADGQPPRVLVLGSLVPLSLAGAWVPDVVEMAGGEPVGCASGAPYRETTLSEVRAADPDVVIVAEGAGAASPGADRTDPVAAVAARPEIEALPGRVWLMDGRRYLSRPGPALYRSVELVAAVVHPERAQVAFRSDELLSADRVAAG